MNAPADAVNAISDLIPGLEAPTVVPLTAKGLVSIQSVVAADDVWAILPDLERAGASGILVLPIQQLIP
jgi:ATP phosphoribosyltransferase